MVCLNDTIEYDSTNTVTDGDYYLGHDHLFSPTVLFRDYGAVAERYEYDAYGKVTIYNSGFTTTFTSSLFGNPYYFTGRRLDTLDSGNFQIMYYRARYYDTNTGRFIQRDPLGIMPSYLLKPNRFAPALRYRDGMNIYQYVKSRSVNSLDPYGLLTHDCCKILLPKLLAHPAVKPYYSQAKTAKNVKGESCLKGIFCDKKCPSGRAGAYYPSAVS